MFISFMSITNYANFSYEKNEIKYAKRTWDECQLQTSYLQISEKLTLLNMSFSHVLLLQRN